MQKVSLKNIIIAIQRSLNIMDERMIGHGEEVAYIMYKLLKASNSYTEDEILRLMEIAFFHDIGAYKIEERDEILDVNLKGPMNHAVYGYLFIKYFSPLSDLAPVVLGHHMDLEDFNEEREKIIPKEALLLHLADYISILNIRKKAIDKDWILEILNNKALPEHKKYFEIACNKYNLLENIQDTRYIEELYQVFDNVVLTREEVISYIRMLTYAIDFRSEATVIHTITVEEVSFQIAKILNINEGEARRIRIASMIHDIGKIAIPIEILEKKSKLTDEEFEKIKEHALIGYKILSNIGLDDLRDIATLHHEKLDGTGYPFGLKGEEIPFETRIVAIADVISALVNKRSYKEEFSKQDVISILLDMALNNKIDNEICNIVIDNYDYIMNNVRQNTKRMLTIYKDLMKEYEIILKFFRNTTLASIDY